MYLGHTTVRSPFFSRIAVVMLGVIGFAAAADAQQPTGDDVVLKFSGHGDAVLLDNVYTNEGAFGLSAWVYVPDEAGSRQTLFWNGGGWGRKGVYLEIAGGTAQRQIVFQLGDGENEVREAGGAFPADRWNHIHVQTNDGKLEYYLNGERVFTTDWAAGYRHNGDMPAQIGAMRDDDGKVGRYFAGSLARMAVWSKTLNQDEIRTAMRGVRGNEAGLVSYFPMSEGRGTTLRDQVRDAAGQFRGEPKWMFAKPFVKDVENKVVNLNEAVTLGPVAISNPTGDLSYQWYRDDKAIDGATGSTLRIDAVTQDDLGTYYVMVDDDRDLTPVTSARARLGDHRWAAAEALVAIRHSNSPEEVYAAFNEFARTHFGAETDDLIYEKFGRDLTLNEDGQWRHVSENSAAVAWQTNLPAESYVEYGPTTAYGQRTETTDRPYSLHIHHIRGLEVGKTYHYRLVATDERGNRITSPNQTLTTAEVANAVYIPGDLQGPPYRLTQSNTTYILTEDLNASATAIIVDRLTENIVLDLNGHTVTFAEGDLQGDDALNVFGIRCNLTTNVKILNGTVKQGGGAALGRNRDSFNFNTVLLVGRNIEMAGMKLEYHAPQAWGARMDRYLGDITVHHNVFKDTGTLVTNRHGSANRVFGGRDAKGDYKQIAIHHNLVQRARQNGFGDAFTLHNNEMYIDSWSTNSFALQPVSRLGDDGGEHHHNRVFATGFNPYGFGWAHHNLTVRDNFIYMFGLDTTHRWGERWGDINLLAGVRITNYSQGGQQRDNLLYHDNLIIMRARGNSEIQGSRFYSDVSIRDTMFRNNVVKAEVLDDETRRAAPLVAQGHYRKDDSLPTYYRDNHLISNNCLIQFGCPYGKGNNHHFINTRFEKIGDNPDFHTFIFDGGFWNRGHIILDGQFGPGTRYDDVYWRNTGSLSMYSVAWTLDLQTNPGMAVTVKDAAGDIVFTGTAGNDGRLAIPLIHCEIRPVEWQAGDTQVRKIEAKTEHQKILKTPHTVTVGDKSVSVTMDGKKSLILR